MYISALFLMMSPLVLYSLQMCHSGKTEPIYLFIFLSHHLIQIKHTFQQNGFEGRLFAVCLFMLD